MTDISLFNQEISAQFSNKEIAQALLSTTFKGLQPGVAQQAMLDGYLRGFKLENFLQKDVYAIPFSGGYSLITSVDWARKIASKAGLAGKDAPVFQLTDEGGVISCSITVYKIVDGVRCPFTSLVFFKEYSTGKNLWASKPMTMIAKVAEMHALRMAFPEELAKTYVEEEVAPVKAEVVSPEVDVEGSKQKLYGALTLEMLAEEWKKLPKSAQMNEEVYNYKEELKMQLGVTKEN